VVPSDPSQPLPGQGGGLPALPGDPHDHTSLALAAWAPELLPT